MLLVVLPLPELIDRHVDVEFRIVGRRAELAHIVGLEVDLLEGVFQRLLALDPCRVVLRHLLLRRQLDAAENHVARVPGLRIEHREGVELILHAEIDQLRVIEPEDALVDMRRMHAVMRAKLQLIVEEREVVLISGAQDDGVELLARPILEADGPAIDARQQRPLIDGRGPMEAHRHRAPAHGDGFRSVFVALQADVLGRIAGADDQHVLAREFIGAAEVMRVHDAAWEGFDAGEVGHVGRREVTRRHHHPIESVAVMRAVRQPLGRHREFA